LARGCCSDKWKCIDAQLGGEPQDDADKGGEGSWEDEAVEGDWIKTLIKIKVPFHKRTLHPGQEEFEAGVFYHRKLVSVIQEKISRPSGFRHLPLKPFEQIYCQSNETAEPVRVHGELYSSPAFVDAHHDLQDSPKEPGCDLPRVIVALMFTSDGTQLTAFSSAKLWPLYLGIGNESKYRRTKPFCRAFEHIAYFELVSKAPWLRVMEIHGFYLIDAFKIYAAERFGGKGPSQAFMAHCQREMYQTQWEIILDAEFLEAFVHGIMIDCFDGICHHFYPRIFTYSADYCEK
jgi:hypothetical protein